MKRIYILSLLVSGLAFSACQTESKLENDLADANYPLPKVVEPVAAPVAAPVMDTADEVLKERTVANTTRPGKKGGYKATVFPKADSQEDEGTAFKLSW